MARSWGINATDDVRELIFRANKWNARIARRNPLDRDLRFANSRWRSASEWEKSIGFGRKFVGDCNFCNDFCYNMAIRSYIVQNPTKTL